jgi:hypothetical protein
MLEGLGRELQAGQQVLAFQVGVLGEQILNCVASRHVFQHGLNRIPQAANDGFAVADVRANGDSRQ